MLWKRILVGDQERILLTKNGRFGGILAPGEYRMFVAPGVSLETEKHDVRQPVFRSAWIDYLVKERPKVAERYFTRVETNDVQVAMVYIDGKLYTVMTPAKRMLFWKGTAEVTAEVVDVIAKPEIPVEKLPSLERLGKESRAVFSIVEEAKTGLLFLHDRLIRTLPPRKYGFWAVLGNPRVEVVDLRRQTLEVSGQEVLSRDKVSLRVSVLAEYQVRDAVKAKQSVTHFEAYLYRLVQVMMRQALGKKTLEEILAGKTEVDETTASAFRAEMNAIGVELLPISVTDIILSSGPADDQWRVRVPETESVNAFRQ